MWVQVSWMPPDYRANLSSLHYHVYYRYTSKTVNASTNSSEILAGSYSYLRAEIGVVNTLTDQLVSEWGRFRSEEIFPLCTNKGESDWTTFRYGIRIRNEQSHSDME